MPARRTPFPRLSARCAALHLYLTIEHKGQVPAEFRAAIGNRIFGCDDCLAVCPWNKYAERAAEANSMAPVRCRRWPICWRWTTPLSERYLPAGRCAGPGMTVSCAMLVAAGNSGDARLVPAAEGLLGHDSPLVRGMAVWALRRLLDEERYMALRATRLPQEEDPSVLAEWG